MWTLVEYMNGKEVDRITTGNYRKAKKFYHRSNQEYSAVRMFDENGNKIGILIADRIFYSWDDYCKYYGQRG